MFGENNTGIADIPVEELPTSEQLKAFMKEQGLKNLAELLRFGIPELNEMDGFDKNCLQSLQELLQRNNMLHRLSQWRKNGG